MPSDKGMRKYRHVEIRYLTMSAGVADALDPSSTVARISSTS